MSTYTIVTSWKKPVGANNIKRDVFFLDCFKNVSYSDDCVSRRFNGLLDRSYLNFPSRRNGEGEDVIHFPFDRSKTFGEFFDVFVAWSDSLTTSRR